MLKIAITGNIASGKSTVEGVLRQKGYKVLDTDFVVHELLEDENVKKQVIATFSDFDILDDNEISHKKLGQIVFKDAALRKTLESILHPLVKIEIEKFFEKEKNAKIIFVSVPLLFETKFELLFDKVILVYADDKIRLNRLIERNNLPVEYAQNRLDIQMSQDEKVKLADYVVYNNKTLCDLSLEIEEILSLL